MVADPVGGGGVQYGQYLLSLEPQEYDRHAGAAPACPGHHRPIKAPQAHQDQDTTNVSGALPTDESAVGRTVRSTINLSGTTRDTVHCK